MATISWLHSAQLPRHNRHTSIRANHDIADAFAVQTVGVIVGNEKLDECMLFVGRDGAMPRQHHLSAKLYSSHPLTTVVAVTGMRTGQKAAENLLLD